MQPLKKKEYLEDNRKGFAIAIVLLVTTLVIVLSLEFNYEMRIDANITINAMDSLKAYYLAKSGIEAGIFAIRMDFKEDKNKNSFVDSFGEIWNIPSVSIPLGNGFITGSISDESGKVNLNTFIQDEEGKKKQGGKSESKATQMMNVVRSILENVPVKSEESPGEIAHAMMEWKGDLFDDDPALESYYSNLDESYESKWDYFDDTSELMLIKGVNKDFYFQKKKSGIEKVPQGLSDIQNNDKSKNKKDSKKSFYSLEDVFTVYSDDPDNNDFKVNINTAPREVIRALHSQIDESMVERIIERQRSSDPFKSVQEAGKDQSLNAVFEDEKDGLKGIKNLIDVKSYFFKLVATGTSGNISKTIEAIIYRNPSDGSINIKSWAVF